MGDEAGMNPYRVTEAAADRVACHFSDGQQGALQQP